MVVILASDTQTHYDLLGVSPDVGVDDLKKAYRKKIRESHPDMNAGSPDADLAHLVNEAYKVLSNAERRAEYDQSLQKAEASGGEHSAPGPDPFDDIEMDWGEEVDVIVTEEPPPTPQPSPGPKPEPRPAPSPFDPDIDVPADAETRIVNPLRVPIWTRLGEALLGLFLVSFLIPMITEIYHSISYSRSINFGETVYSSTVYFAAGVIALAVLAPALKSLRGNGGKVYAGLRYRILLGSGVVIAALSQVLMGASVAITLFVIFTTVILVRGLLRPRAIFRAMEKIAPERAVRDNNLLGSLNGTATADSVDRLLREFLIAPGIKIIRNSDPASIFSHVIVKGSRALFLQGLGDSRTNPGGRRYRWSGPSLMGYDAAGTYVVVQDVFSPKINAQDAQDIRYLDSRMYALIMWHDGHADLDTSESGPATLFTDETAMKRAIREWILNDNDMETVVYPAFVEALLALHAEPALPVLSDGLLV